MPYASVISKFALSFKCELSEMSPIDVILNYSVMENETKYKK